MTVKEALAFIYDENKNVSRPGLERMSELLGLLGDPQRQCSFVQVTGTNGKGSFCHMLSEILAGAGYRTGVYTSPALTDIYERIVVDRRRITPRRLAELTSVIRPAAESMRDAPTRFELETALAFLHFAREKCGVVILEVGMGGALDATNVISSNILSVIMNISLDHTRELGDTVEKIAAVKSEIVKKGSPCVFYGEDPEALAVIEKKCAKEGSALICPERSSLRIKKVAPCGSVFSYKQYEDVFLPLAGKYQIYNAVTVIEALGVLAERGFAVPPEKVAEGFAELAPISGRLEFALQKPYVIYDGAHNPGGFEALFESLKAIFGRFKATVIMGVMRDKDYAKCLGIAAPYVKKLYAVTPGNKRALDREKLAESARRAGIDAEALGDPESFLLKEVQNSSDNDIILICGSLYLYKDASKWMRAVRELAADKSAASDGNTASGNAADGGGAARKTVDKKAAIAGKNMKKENKMITIAIDGPSGAGKSTVAKALAKEFKIGYLDTGAMYRTAALYMDRKLPQLSAEVAGGGICEATRRAIVDLLGDADIRVVYDENSAQHMYIGDEDVSALIRTPVISMEASKVSAIPEVRVYLVDMQRRIGETMSVVMDGRDIGTHVMPGATVKIYLTASPEERARRRYLELIEKDPDTVYEDVLKDIIARDYGDSHREVSPLRQAGDAVLLDTTELSLEDSIAAAVSIAKEAAGLD